MSTNPPGYMALWYATHPGKRKDYDAPYSSVKRASNLVLIWQEKCALGCSRCGYNEHGSALDWHHPTGDKERRLTVLGYFSPLQAVERAKCVLLCANCHRIAHNEKIAENGDVYSDTNLPAPGAFVTLPQALNMSDDMVGS